jgi:5-bromo-4-chloroindolyl phosphate hydrolysis protein
MATSIVLGVVTSGVVYACKVSFNYVYGLWNREEEQPFVEKTETEEAITEIKDELKNMEAIKEDLKSMREIIDAMAKQKEQQRDLRLVEEKKNNIMMQSCIGIGSKDKKSLQYRYKREAPSD